MSAHPRFPLTLGVNIDHVATVRQARRIAEPDPVTAALIAELAGARCITAHLREDRRHIQGHDVHRLRSVVKTKLNMEMAVTEEMVAIALDVRPDQVCLVPEKRTELTTEGGLDLKLAEAGLGQALPRLQGAGIRVSLFVDPDLTQVRLAREVGADIVELHTGSYAEAHNEAQRENQRDRIAAAAAAAHALGLEVHAGHGLNYRNVAEIASIPQIRELNIGHSIVSHALFTGFERAVKEMLAAMAEGRAR